MYTLKNFCNTIAGARRKKGWSQAEFAEKLHISAQSVSKWECGIGYPDVSLFPEIAEVLGVTMETLFGGDADAARACCFSKEFEKCVEIKILVGNVCRVQVIEEEREKTLVEADGDSTFLAYFSAEKEGDTLLVEVKNPTGSAERWEAYDRGGYRGENLLRVRRGREGNLVLGNYLNLREESRECPGEGIWTVDFLSL